MRSSTVSRRACTLELRGSPEEGELSLFTPLGGTAAVLSWAADAAVLREQGREPRQLEGEGDLSLEHWRSVHEEFFTEHAQHDKGFNPQMPVVCERFRVLSQD